MNGSPQPCPLCGAVSLYDDGWIDDVGTARFICENCFFEGCAGELIEAMHEQIVDWWDKIDLMDAELFKEPRSEKAIRSLAYVCLKHRIPPEAVEQLLSAVNSARQAPLEEGALGPLMVEAAKIVASERRDFA